MPQKLEAVNKSILKVAAVIKKNSIRYKIHIKCLQWTSSLQSEIRH